MPRSIVLRSHGDPSVLVEEAVAAVAPGPGELLVRHTAIAVNFHDVYVRNGSYRTLSLPGIPGLEAVGVVEAVGPEVSGFGIGDRIAYVDDRYGAYCEQRVLDSTKAIHLPPTLPDLSAAASLMKGMTTHVLLNEVGRVMPGQTVVIHAAAGGMGQLLCCWASSIGARVIGTVGSEAKAALARESGAHHTILYETEDVAAQVMNLTGGSGAHVVFDSVGAATIEGSLDSLGLLGQLVCFGQASGPAQPIPLGRLAERSLTVSRPILFHFIKSPDRLAAIAQATLSAFEQGILKPIEPLALPLDQAAEAHRIIEARQSPGGIVLIP